jgi:tetratricopeptide (TPR) repeat protein
LGVAYSILGKIDDAIQEYKILVQLDANDPEGYYGLGSIYLGLNQPEQALAQFKKAEELYKQQASPYVVDAQYALGLSYFAVEDCRNARDYLELIYPQNENDPKVNYFLGSCYLTPELKNLELARKYLHKAQELGVEIPADQLQMINP